MLYSIDPSKDTAPHYPIVMRFQSLDGGRTAATAIVILDMFPDRQEASHQISNLSIGPDGKLYVHMADGLNTKAARDLDDFRGKILRMNLDGSPAVDNPFYSAVDGISARDYVYASGFRNPFGGGWAAADGFLYEVENGPSIDRLARVVAGRDYLWDGDNADMTNFAIYNWSPSVAPVNIAFIQPETFSGSGFPADKMDHIFVSESGPTWASGPQAHGKRISEFILGANGEVVSGPHPLIEYNGTGKATIAALAAGPDGLYFSDLYKDLDYTSPVDRGAKIFRIKPKALRLSVNETGFRPGAMMTLMVTIASEPAPQAVDLYVALQLPDQSLWFLQADGRLTPELHPLVASWVVVPFNGELWRYTFSGTEPAGRYSWLAAFTEPGTMNILGTIAEAPFTFSP